MGIFFVRGEYLTAHFFYLCENNKQKIKPMALEQQIQNDIAAAMKARNQVKLDALRAVKSAILIAKTAGADITLTDADIVKIMQKQVKQRRESAEMYTSAGRPELAEAELAQAAAIEEYLPKQLSPEELEHLTSCLRAVFRVELFFCGLLSDLVLYSKHAAYKPFSAVL